LPYFVPVFEALGTIRMLGVVPRFGARLAELMETPILFVVVMAAWFDLRSHR